MSLQRRPTHHDTRAQYARQARRYAESALHARGESLETVRRLTAAGAADTVLDLGTGAGFTAFALAADVGCVVGADLTPEMIREARRLADQRGLDVRLRWAIAAAERLPFADGAFAAATSRYASHHFHDLPLALRELARVVRPRGRVVLCDVVAPEGPGMAELMNRLERLRDPTHVCDYPVSQWVRELLPNARLEVLKIVEGTNPQAFIEWVERAGTPPERAAELAAMFANAPPEARRAFHVRHLGEDILFSWPNATIVAAPR